MYSAGEVMIEVEGSVIRAYDDVTISYLWASQMSKLFETKH